MISLSIASSTASLGGMNGVSSRPRKKAISAEDLASKEFLKVPHDVKPTALGLWVHTDPWGRREVIPELIAANVYPGEAAADRVIEHLLILEECGFLNLYQADGAEWLQLTRPLKTDQRGAQPECPQPPTESSRKFMAVGRARERAREQMREESRVRDARWEREPERLEMPDRPLLLNAPPIGCSEHPSGHDHACGPCRDARLNRDLWLTERVYERQLTEFYEQDGGDYVDEEPF